MAVVQRQPDPPSTWYVTVLTANSQNTRNIIPFLCAVVFTLMVLFLKLELPLTHTTQYRGTWKQRRTSMVAAPYTSIHFMLLGSIILHYAPEQYRPISTSKHRQWSSITLWYKFPMSYSRDRDFQHKLTGSHDPKHSHTDPWRFLNIFIQSPLGLGSVLW
jgi:hypothetical protein